MMGMDVMGDLGWLGMGGMWLGAFVPLALIVGVGWLLARGAGGRDEAPRGNDAAAILRRRLATGEIGVEQYDEARAALGLAGGARERLDGMSTAPLRPPRPRASTTPGRSTQRGTDAGLDRSTQPAPRQQRGTPVPAMYGAPQRPGGATGPIRGSGQRAR